MIPMMILGAIIGAIALPASFYHSEGRPRPDEVSVYAGIITFFGALGGILGGALGLIASYLWLPILSLIVVFGGTYAVLHHVLTRQISKSQAPDFPQAEYNRAIASKDTERINEVIINHVRNVKEWQDG